MNLEKSKTPPPLLIASDAAGWALKNALQKACSDLGWMDLGPHSPKETLDYPDAALNLCKHIQSGQASQGVLICGTGIGMSIAANKLHGIRAAVVDQPWAARLAKEHNHANVLCLGARVTALEYAIEILRGWLQSPYSEEKRHIQRLTKISNIEQLCSTGSPQ